MDRTYIQLPKTTEAATTRYLHHYKKNYIGPAKELFRLSSVAEAFIHQLRKVAPKFYEEKLPTLINQAASALLTCSTNTPEGALKFNRTHAHLMLILRDLKKSQPAGEINFQDERDRVEARQKLLARQLAIQKRINELEATEFDCDDLGEEEEDNLYSKVMNELNELKIERKMVCLEIACMEGQEIEEEAHFELRVPRNSVLSRLTDEQLKNLEQQMLEFYKAKNMKKTALYVDKDIIDGMIEKLNIDTSLFKKEELKELSKNALDAYKSYYRELDSQKRGRYHEELLRNKYLMPKEGEIISNPDDIPDHVRQKLDRTDLEYKRQIEELIENYSRQNHPENGDNCNDNDDEVESPEEDMPDDDTPKIFESIKKRNTNFYARIKEEPRDDYVEIENLAEDDLVIDSELAESLIDGEKFKEVKQEAQPISSANGASGSSLSEDENNMDYEDDDDIECLGTVEPSDKVQTFNLE